MPLQTQSNLIELVHLILECVHLYVSDLFGADFKISDLNISDCGDSGCLNGGSVDPNTCHCTCDEGQVGPRCASKFYFYI
jgi:hypothetical protein